MRLPYIIIYTTNLPSGINGRANGPVIRIKPEYRDDRGVLEHELIHVRQWWVWVLIGAMAALAIFYAPMSPRPEYWPFALMVGAVVHPLLYALVPRYRLWSEVQAFAEQARWYADDRKPLFAGFIARNYGLTVAESDVLELLK